MPLMRAVRRGVASLITLCTLVAGCAIQGPKPEPAQAATNADTFAIEGRVSVRYGEESLSGKIAWAHTETRDEISLASPLGNQLALIVREPAGVTLTDANQARYRAADVETLTERQLGWPLPLAGLSDWVRSRPGANAVVRRDAAGRPTRISESGWEIDFDYEGEARLPRRLVMVFTRAARPLEIRLVIDGWS